MQTISPYNATEYKDALARLALQRANIMHLVDLKRGGYSPRRTELRRPWSRPLSNQSLRSSSPSPERPLILIHFNATRRPARHRHARRLGSPSLRPRRPHQSPNRAASPGSGMPAGPLAWRHSSSAEPRNAKPNFAGHPGKQRRRTCRTNFNAN
jgi:hypothetical protein